MRRLELIMISDLRFRGSERCRILYYWTLLYCFCLQYCCFAILASDSDTSNLPSSLYSYRSNCTIYIVLNCACSCVRVPELSRAEEEGADWRIRHDERAVSGAGAPGSPPCQLNRNPVLLYDDTHYKQSAFCSASMLQILHHRPSSTVILRTELGSRDKSDTFLIYYESVIIIDCQVRNPCETKRET